MTNVSLPRLLDATLRPVGTLSPISLSIQLNLSSLSTASMILPPGQGIAVGQFVRLFTQQGSAGIFRVEQVEQGDVTRVALAHGLVTLADGLFQVEQESITLAAPGLFRDILSRQQRWQAGTIALPEEQLVTCQAGAATLLEALWALMTALPGYRLVFDQDTTPWMLHVLPLTQEDLCECRLTRNLQSLTIETDRRELCTQLYLPGMEQPLEADTLAQWGPVARRLEADSGLTEEELLQRGRQFLAQHKDPLITVTLDALDLSRLTGSTLDSFRLGVPCRVCLPEEHTAITQRVVGLSWPDALGAPEQVRITLANRPKSAASLLAGLIIDSTQVKRQVTRQWDALGRHKNLLIQADESITMLSRSIDIHAQDILTLRSGVGENEARITLADGRIEANAREIALHGKELVTLQSGVDDNAASITLANGRIEANAREIALKASQTEVTEQGQRLSSAEVAIDGANAAIKLKADKTTVDEQGKRLSTAEANIDGANAAIKLKADKTTVDEQGKRLSTAEANIDGANATIKLKADKTTVDEQGKRLSTAEVAIDGANAAIKLKADKTTVDAQGKRLSTAEVAIDGAKADIKLKADKTTVDEQGKRLSTAEANIDGANAAIKLKADKTTVDEQGKRLSTAEANIDGANAAIKLKADKTTVDEQGKRLSTAEANIDGANAAIKLKADKTTVDEQGKRLSTAEVAIDGAKADIKLKASKETVDDLGNRLTAAEASIQVNANGITSKVSKNGIISAINQTAETVRISASKIELNGTTIVSLLKGASIDAKAITVTDGYVSALETDTITTGKITAEEIQLGGGVGAVASQSWVSSNYIPMANLTSLATQMWVGTNYATKASLDDYQLKTGLTTKTIKPVTSLSIKTGTTPAFYKGDTMMSNGIPYVQSVSYSTTEYSVVVYA